MLRYIRSVPRLQTLPVNRDNSPSCPLTDSSDGAARNTAVAGRSSSFFRGLFRALLFTAAMPTVVLLSGCTSQDSDGRSGGSRAARPTTIRIVHGPELRPLLSSLRESFYLTKPTLADGSEVRVELQSVMGIIAAEQIARGDIKAEGWIAPSTSLVNYTNFSVRNLGARQTDCTSLFSTPVVLATREKNIGEFNAAGQIFSWVELLERQRQVAGEEAMLSFSHGTPRSSSTGLTALTQLALLAAPGRPDTVSLEALSQDATIQQLRRYQSFVADYSLSEHYLLARSARFESRRVRSTITTEQQVAIFNSSLPTGAEKLVALYPSEGSIWDDYQICRSGADWVTVPHQAAVQRFAEFLRSPDAQFAARRQGFRPSQPTADAAPLLPEYGVNLTLPERSFLPASGEAIAHILKSWPEYIRPAALVIALDTSGSMEGDSLERSKEQVRNLVARMNTRDLRALVTFATRPTVAADFSTKVQDVTPKIDPLQALGGSSLYDAIRLAIELITKNESLIEYRRQIIVITDGDDKNSEGSLQGTVDLVKDKLSRNDIKLVVVALTGQGTNFDDIRRIVDTANGYLFEVDSARLPELFQELALSLDGTTP